MVLDHIFDLQALHTHDLVLTYDLSRELVLVVTPSIGNTSMDTSDFETGFCSILRAFFLLCMPSVSFCQLLFILGKEFRVAMAMTIRGDDHALEPQVKPNLFVNHWQGLNIVLSQDRDKVPVSTIFCHRNGCGLASFGQGARPMDIKGSIHLGKSQTGTIPLESRRGIGHCLWSVFFLESGELSTSFKEIEESSIQMTEGLL